MNRNHAISLKTLAQAYGISTKTLSKRIKTIIPAKKDTRIRILFPAEVDKIIIVMGDFKNA